MIKFIYIISKWLGNWSLMDTKRFNSDFVITVGLYMAGLGTIILLLYTNIGNIYHILVITNTLLFNKYISDKIKMDDRSLLVNIIWNGIFITVLNITSIWGAGVVEGLWGNNATHCDGGDYKIGNEEIKDNGENEGREVIRENKGSEQEKGK